jgi:hypothetical protein
MHAMLHDAFHMHNLPVNEGGFQMSIEVEVVHEDQLGFL